MKILTIAIGQRPDSKIPTLSVNVDGSYEELSPLLDKIKQVIEWTMDKKDVILAIQEGEEDVKSEAKVRGGS